MSTNTIADRPTVILKEIDGVSVPSVDWSRGVTNEDIQEFRDTHIELAKTNPNLLGFSAAANPMAPQLSEAGRNLLDEGEPWWKVQFTTPSKAGRHFLVSANNEGEALEAFREWALDWSDLQRAKWSPDDLVVKSVTAMSDLYEEMRVAADADPEIVKRYPNMVDSLEKQREGHLAQRKSWDEANPDGVVYVAKEESAKVDPVDEYVAHEATEPGPNFNDFTVDAMRMFTEELDLAIGAISAGETPNRNNLPSGSWERLSVAELDGLSNDLNRLGALASAVDVSEADKLAAVNEGAAAIVAMLRVANARENYVTETHGEAPVRTYNEDGSVSAVYYPRDSHGHEWFTYRTDGGQDVFTRLDVDRNADGIIETEWQFKFGIEPSRHGSSPVIQPDEAGYNGPRYTGPDSPSQVEIAAMMARVGELDAATQDLLKKYQQEASLRARNPDGTFTPDDPTTTDVNEAWADGVGPTPTEES